MWASPCKGLRWVFHEAAIASPGRFKCVVPGASGRIINASSSDKFTLNGLHQNMSALLVPPFAPIYTQARAGDIHDCWASIACSGELLSLQPQKNSLEASLRQLLDFTTILQDQANHERL